MTASILSYSLSNRQTVEQIIDRAGNFLPKKCNAVNALNICQLKLMGIIVIGCKLLNRQKSPPIVLKMLMIKALAL